MGITNSIKKSLGGGKGYFSGDPVIGYAGESLFKPKTPTTPTPTPPQVTVENLFRSLSSEQQKDLLINNPNILTSQGKQFYDPFTNTITLEESEFQKGQRGRQELLAQELSGQLTGQSLPGTDSSSRFEEGRQLLAPQFQEDRERLSQQLADQGLPVGSEAHARELNRLEKSQGRQLQELSFNSVQTTEAQRAARFNEISSLLGQQQVGGVGFGDFGAQRSGLDLFGAEQAGLNRAFQADQARKDRSAAQKSAIIGAVGSLGGAAVGGFASDRNLKENIVEVAKSENGLTIYHFDYINKEYGEGRYEGVMAQDLLETNPDAILQVGDKLAVNYDLIDVNFRRID